MFKLQSPSKYSPWCFSTAQNSFWTCQFWCLLVLLPFVSPLPHGQNFCLWGLFFIEETKRSCLGWDWVNREGGAWGSFCVLVKNCWTLSTMWAGLLVSHPSWNVQTCWKSLQKNSLKPNAASHNNASWYTDTDGSLEHSPSEGNLYYKGPVLQKIIQFFWAPPYVVELCDCIKYSEK